MAGYRQKLLKFTIKEIALAVRRQFSEMENKTYGKTWTRADLLRGFVADVGALAKLTMAADGLREIPNYQEKLGHELADCLWSIIVLADEYNIDLENEFESLISSLSNKLPRT
jgi:NTP pyrophosphatase (non-canonical NTP hydrolase)